MIRAYAVPCESHSGFDHRRESMKQRSFSLNRLPTDSDFSQAKQTQIPLRPPKTSLNSETRFLQERGRSRKPISSHFQSNPNLLEDHLNVSRSNAEWRAISKQLESRSLSSSDSITSVDHDSSGTTVIVQVKAPRTPESQRKSRPRSMNIQKELLMNVPRKPNITGGVKVLPTSTNLNQNFTRSVPNIPEATKALGRSPLQFEPELNSVQVFRQPKYKQRYKSKQKIRQIDHLNSSDPCEKQMEFIHEQLETRDYGNMDPVSSFQSPRLPPKPKPKENIYEEVDETLTSDFKRRQNSLLDRREQRKVTFQLPTEALHGIEEVQSKKKIIAVRLYGIAEVLKPLRNSSDEQRRAIARMSYRAVRLKYQSYSLNFLGKVDVSRAGEEVFIVLERDAFEIHDSRGMVLTRHQRHDISVITAILEEPRVITYIGKCKFLGRIAMVLKFNKSKHLKSLNSLFNPSREKSS